MSGRPTAASAGGCRKMPVANSAKPASIAATSWIRRSRSMSPPLAWNTCARRPFNRLLGRSERRVVERHAKARHLVVAAGDRRGIARRDEAQAAGREGHARARRVGDVEALGGIVARAGGSHGAGRDAADQERVDAQGGAGRRAGVDGLEDRSRGVAAAGGGGRGERDRAREVRRHRPRPGAPPHCPHPTASVPASQRPAIETGALPSICPLTERSTCPASTPASTTTWAARTPTPA